MAKINKNNPSMDFPLQIARQYGAPLDKNSVFYSMSEAQTYASSSPLAYAGQVIAVVDETAQSTNVYKISIGGELEEVGTSGGSDTVKIIDLTTQDENTWYPILIHCYTKKVAHITVTANLGNSGKPSWSTHSDGFWCLAEWSAVGNGGGQTPGALRNVIRFDYRFGDNILGMIGQMTQPSYEYIYVRGGGVYAVTYNFPNCDEPFVVLGSLTAEGQTISSTTVYPHQSRGMSIQQEVSVPSKVIVQDLDVRGVCHIYHPSSSTYLELGKVGNTGVEFHCQSDPNAHVDYDAYIQANSATSSSSVGTAALNYNAREHNFNSPVNMGGALNLANGTWNLSGVDAYFGDANRAGTFCIKGKNGPTALELFDKDGDSDSVRMEYTDNNLTFNKPIISKNGNDFISNNNEFNFIGDDFTYGTLFLNYRGGNFSSYKFCNGTGDHLANGEFANVYDNGTRVYSSNNPPPVPTSTAYYHLMGTGWANANSMRHIRDAGSIGTGLISVTNMYTTYEAGYTYFLFGVRNDNNEWVYTLIPRITFLTSSSSRKIILNGGSTPNTARYVVLWYSTATSIYIEKVSNINFFEISMLSI